MDEQQFESGEVNTSDEYQQKLALEKLGGQAGTTLPMKKYNLKIESERLNIEAKEIFKLTVESFISQALQPDFEQVKIDVSEVPSEEEPETPQS